MTVCKGFTRLAIHSFYENNTFCFQHPYNDLPVFVLQLSGDALKAIRSVKIQLDPYGHYFPYDGLDLLLCASGLRNLDFDCCGRTVKISTKKRKILELFRLTSFNWSNCCNSEDGEQ